MVRQERILTGPFTMRRARDHGFSRHVVRTGPYAKVAQDTYVALRGTADPAPLLVRARAALMHCSAGTAISHHTAGRLLGLHLPPDQRVHVAVPGERYRTRRVGIAAHRLAADHELILVEGLPCTNVLGTLADLAATIRLPDLTAAVDEALGQRLVSVDELRRYALGRARSGSRVLRQALELADRRSGSPMESRTRVLVRLAGYPEPEAQYPVCGGSGQRYYLDMAFPEWKVALEYDGRQHAQDAKQYAWDLRRREDLTLSGWMLVTAVSDDIYVRPTGLLDRLDAAVLAAGGCPPNRRVTWAAYFGRG